MILLSIITPAFNSAKWLNACILNVASQMVDGELEHLIIDGGSTDESLEILKENTKQFPHLRWISEPDSGQSNAMNKGIKMAAGKWIGFLNADDFYQEYALERVLEIIRKSPDSERLLVGNLQIWNEDNQLISINKASSMSLPKLLADICEWPFNPSAYFYPKSIHQQINYFNEEEHFAMDYDFILRVMVAQIKIEYHNEIWGNFRLLPAAKTSKDQASNNSYLRAERLRQSYLACVGIKISLEVRFLRLLWDIRNKGLGLWNKLYR